jgi:hypothetical protein
MADTTAARARLLRLSSELAKERSVAERIGDEVLADSARLQRLPLDVRSDPSLE